MSTETELKLWHWYAMRGQITGEWIVVLPTRVDESEGGAFLTDGDGHHGLYATSDLIGPIAGPGEPPEAPKNREEAERMAREWSERAHHDRLSLDSVCMTWRHDFGLLDGAEQDRVRAMMGQVHNHHVVDVVRERDSLRGQLQGVEEAHALCMRRATRAERERDEWKRRAEDAERKDDKTLWEAMTHAGRVGVIRRAKQRRTRWLLSRVKAAGNWIGDTESATRIHGIVQDEVHRLDAQESASLSTRRDDASGSDAPAGTPAGHVRVRIAVAAGLDATWSASGCDAEDDREKTQSARAGMEYADGVHAIAFIEADVPLPHEPETVRGRVTAQQS